MDSSILAVIRHKDVDYFQAADSIYSVSKKTEHIFMHALQINLVQKYIALTAYLSWVMYKANGIEKFPTF